MEGVTGNFIVVEKTEIFSQIQSFVKRNGIIPVNDVKQIKNGRNSQAYLIDQGDYKWIVKKYHQHANDPRNRMETEFRFLTFLNDNKIDKVAKPIASDSDNNLGLFSYLNGKVPKTLNRDLVNQAGEFIRKINESRSGKSSKELSEASESCFSIMSHLQCVRKRVHRLNNMLISSPLQYEVSAFVQSSLISSLDKITKEIIDKYSDKELQKPLPYTLRIISPSDFGFQNTLIDNHTLYFLDFEYAGWDDPAKLICDFGCHPEIPVKDEYLKILKNSFLPWLEDAEDSIHRSEILMQLYRLKWCCIILNEFTLVGRDRRSHARNMFDYENQLQKSKTYYTKYLS